MNFRASCQIHQVIIMLYFVSTISSPTNCTYSSIGISTLPRFKEEMRLANSFVASVILDFSHSYSMAKLAVRSASEVLDILQLFHLTWGIHLSPHFRAPHKSMPYNRRCFPQVIVSSGKIKLRGNPFPKLLFTFNSKWSNYSIIQGLYHTCKTSRQKTIIILLNCKVGTPNDSPLWTCFREWVAWLFILKSAFCIWDLKFYSEAHPSTLKYI